MGVNMGPPLPSSTLSPLLCPQVVADGGCEASSFNKAPSDQHLGLVCYSPSCGQLPCPSPSSSQGCRFQNLHVLQPWWEPWT